MNTRIILSSIAALFCFFVVAASIFEYNIKPAQVSSNKPVLKIIYVGNKQSTSPSISATDNQGNRATLYAEKCTEESILKQSNFPEKMKRAVILYKGRQINACWILDPSSVVLILDTDMDVTALPISSFSPDITY